MIIWSKRRFVKAVIFCALLCLVMPVHAASNRIYYNNQDLFLNGANLAWQHFADGWLAENYYR
jgi:hypothetical protein